MPELLIDFITSLDGYAAADGWPGWWGLEGPEYLAWLGEQPEGGYTILMGAATYRLMSQFAAEGEPGTGGLAAMPKIVFSTTLNEPLSWPNSRLVTQDPVEAVREMKDKAETPMRTIGSLTLCRSLLKAGLVDRFRVVVFPVITGSSGRERIYDGYPDVGLHMTCSRTFDGGIQLLEYVPTILAGPPGVSRAGATYTTRTSWHVNAPRSAVYRALLDPGAVARWRVPDGMTGHVHEFDPREGGTFRVSLTYDAPGPAGKSASGTDTYHGRFTRLVPDRQVTEVVEFETADPALAGEMTITTTLADADGGTDIHLIHDGVPAAVPPADNETGQRMALSNLAALVEASHQN